MITCSRISVKVVQNLQGLLNVFLLATKRSQSIFREDCSFLWKHLSLLERAHTNFEMLMFNSKNETFWSRVLVCDWLVGDSYDEERFPVVNDDSILGESPQVQVWKNMPSLPCMYIPWSPRTTIDIQHSRWAQLRVSFALRLWIKVVDLKKYVASGGQIPSEWRDKDSYVSRASPG